MPLPCAEGRGGQRTPRRFCPASIAVIITLLACIAATALFTGSTYALARHVRHLAATASVDPDPAVWDQQARSRGYDGCYLGCAWDDNACNADPTFAEKACNRTAQAGPACDAARMWNWREADKYPDKCLRVVGELYKADALADKKKKYLRLYALILLFLCVALLVGFAVYKLLKHAVAMLEEWRWNRPVSSSSPPRPSFWARFRQRQARTQCSGESEEEAGLWAKLRQRMVQHRGLESATEDDARETKSHKSSTEGQETATEKVEQETKRPGRISTMRAAIVVALTIFSGRVRAFPCAGKGGSGRHFFVNANRTIYAIGEYWTSDCFQRQVCHDTCGSCGSGSTGTCCSTTCSTQTRVWTEAHVFMDRVIPKIQDCGFEVANETQALLETNWLRVGNPEIEKNHWVRIRVNGFNVTSPDTTDEEVWCLYNIGNTKPK